MNPSDKNTDSEFPNFSPSVTYSVQVGAFRNPAYARRLLNELTEMDFPARTDDSSQYDRVLVGQFDVLNDAAMMERRLKQSGYPTVIVSFSEEA
nr:SPOR domain-containing protein [Coprococcus sp. AF102-57]